MNAGKAVTRKVTIIGYEPVYMKKSSSIGLIGA